MEKDSLLNIRLLLRNIVVITQEVLKARIFLAWSNDNAAKVFLCWKCTIPSSALYHGYSKLLLWVMVDETLVRLRVDKGGSWEP
jgi:hypothetical protein